MSPGFWAALWQGTVRQVKCPYCHGKQQVARRAMPFEVSCQECGRAFLITERGVEATSKG